MQDVRDDIDYNNHSSHGNQDTNYSSSDMEEKSQEPQDENYNDNSPKNGMKHGNTPSLKNYERHKSTRSQLFVDLDIQLSSI